MSDIVEAAIDLLKNNDKCIFQVLQTVAAAVASLASADLSKENTLALLRILDEAERRIQEITQSGL